MAWHIYFIVIENNVNDGVWIKFGYSKDNDGLRSAYFTHNPLIRRNGDPESRKPNFWFAKMHDDSKGLDTKLKNMLLDKGFEERRDKSEWIYICNRKRFNNIIQWFQDEDWSSKQRTKKMSKN